MPADEKLDGREAEEGVEEPARDVPEPLPDAEVIVARLELLAERRYCETPERIAGEADRDHDEERGAPPLAGELLQRARPVGRLSAGSQRELDGEEADQAVEEPGRSHAQTAEPPEP